MAGFKPADPAGRILTLGGKTDPPYPPLKKGGTGSEVPLLKGDLGGLS